MSDELKFAIATAQHAGEMLKKSFRKDVGERPKGLRDVVTKADFSSQKFITGEIRRNFPKHDIMGEESGALKDEIDTGKSAKWLVDPLDGTVNYVAGIPAYCVSIALARGGEPKVGVIYDPTLGEMFYAERNRGAYLNGKRIFVTERPLRHSLIGMSFSKNFEKTMRMLDVVKKLQQQVRRFRSFGSTSLEAAYVACGRTAAYVNPSSTPWDFAAAKVIVEEAGGVTGDARGKPWQFGSTSVVAANSKETLSVISKAFLAAEKKG
ncbi:inositol monophosphatase [Candidatus Micrarchaeota archaeon]|nr:inositol monophosphatase [Candidatus Micrarchaeota archaeon]